MHVLSDQSGYSVVALGVVFCQSASRREAGEATLHLVKGFWRNRAPMSDVGFAGGVSNAATTAIAPKAEVACSNHIMCASFSAILNLSARQGGQRVGHGSGTGDIIY